MRLQTVGSSNQLVRADGEAPSLRNKGSPQRPQEPLPQPRAWRNRDVGLSRHLGGGAAPHWVSARLCLQYPAPIGRALKRATSEAEP